MKGRLLKSIGMICLSILFSYSGVAWAWDDCLRDDGEENVEEQPAIGNFEVRDLLLDFPGRSGGAPASRVHCFATHHEFDALVQSSSTGSLTQPGKGTQLKPSLPGASTSVNGMNTLGRRPHLDSFVTSSPPGFLSRYLFLSVFLI